MLYRYCTVLGLQVLYCTVLYSYCIVLGLQVMCCTVLYRAVLVFYAVLYCFELLQVQVCSVQKFGLQVLYWVNVQFAGQDSEDKVQQTFVGLVGVLLSLYWVQCRYYLEGG